MALAATPSAPSATIGRQSLLFVTGCLFEESSGPYLSLKQTAEALQQRGHAVTVVGTKPWRAGQPRGWFGEVLAFRRYGPVSAHFAPHLGQWLRQQPARWEVASMQGVWMHTNHLVAEWCIRHDRPFMITAHGNFNPVALRISAWKKSLARRTFMRRVFERVRCYQALTEIEYQTLRAYGIREPVCIIGNGITRPILARLSSPETLLPCDLLQRRTCLYLGRLFPIKGIDRLLRAWATVRPGDEWQLVIAGGGEATYRAELEYIAQRSGCLNVHFVGFVSGSLKSAWLQQAEFFVLPSHSEAFPMASLEAFSFGKPALLTAACGLPEAAKAGAALEVPSSEAGIRDGLMQLQSKSKAELNAMGSQAMALIRERYDWEVICRQLESVYDWMCGSSQIPDCLRLD
ncbi:MAG: glycosyltransferase [Candidatus Contendobacter sp.]|nr:glycosyltransferase [Candidatus Contendobacter sp.]